METQHKPETVVIRFGNSNDGSEVMFGYSPSGKVNNLRVMVQGESLVPLLQQYAMENFVSRIGYFPVRLEMADGTVFETAMMIRGQEMDFASNTVTKVDMGVIGFPIKQSRREVSTAV